MTHSSQADLKPADADLAVAFALGYASEADQSRAEHLMAESPSFAQAVQNYETAGAALSYTVPLQPLKPQLKTQLFDSLGLAPPVEPKVSAEPDILTYLSWSIEELIQRSESLDWLPLNIMPSFSIATLATDEVTRTTACFVKADVPATFPCHEHAQDEVILVLAGDVWVGDQVYRAGSRIDSKVGSSHGPSTQTGCLLFCVSSMDDKYPATQSA